MSGQVTSENKAATVTHSVLNVILLICLILVVARIAFDSGGLSYDEIVQHSVVLGLPFAVKILWVAGTAVAEMGSSGIILFLCLPLGLGVWLSAQFLTVGPALRDSLMTFGSALTGVFLGGLSRHLGVGSQSTTQRGEGT